MIARRLLLLAASLLPSQVLAEALTAAQAAQRVGETVTVEFRVRGTGANAAGYEELYSEASWLHPDAFFIRLPAGTEVARYAGRSIRVTGQVVSNDHQPMFKRVDHTAVLCDQCFKKLGVPIHEAAL